MKTILTALRLRLSTSVARARTLRAEISKLSYAEPSAACPSPAAAYRALQKEGQEDKVAGRAARKALRRPATGPCRSCLWNDKRNVKQTARHESLALRYVRDQGSLAKGRAGHPYAWAEPKVRAGNEPMPGLIASILEEAGMDVSVETITAWLKATPAASLVATAASMQAEPQLAHAS